MDSWLIVNHQSQWLMEHHGFLCVKRRWECGNSLQFEIDRHLGSFQPRGNWRRGGRAWQGEGCRLSSSHSNNLWAPNRPVMPTGIYTLRLMNHVGCHQTATIWYVLRSDSTSQKKNNQGLIVVCNSQSPCELIDLSLSHPAMILWLQPSESAWKWPHGAHWGPMYVVGSLCSSHPVVIRNK